MSNNKIRKTRAANFSREQKLLLIRTRLALEADYQKCSKNHKKITNLWENVQRKIIEKDPSMKNVTIQHIQALYAEHLAAFKKIKENNADKDILEAEIIDMFEQAKAEELNVSNNKTNKVAKQANICILKKFPSEVVELVINARLSREAAFQKCLKNSAAERNALWRQALCEVNAKATPDYAMELSVTQIQQIYRNMLKRYQTQKTNESTRKPTCPYYEQFDKVYANANELATKEHDASNDTLKQVVLQARLSRAAAFKKLAVHDRKERNRLWMQILAEVNRKTNAELTSVKVQKIFSNLLLIYRRIKKAKGNKSDWPYFKQLNDIYSHDIASEAETAKQAGDNLAIKLWIVNARLARDADFKQLSKGNTIERDLLWRQILGDVNAKAASRSIHLKKTQMQRIFYRLANRYKIHKRNGNKKNWRFFKQMNKIYENENLLPLKYRTKDYRHLQQVVLSERLAREADFQKAKTDQNSRSLLWQQILQAIKTKVKATGCTGFVITKPNIQKIFHKLIRTYKAQKTNSAIECDKPCLFFEQIDAVYGKNINFKYGRPAKNYDLNQLTLDAILSREAKFKKLPRSCIERDMLWEEILWEITEKGCTEALKRRKIHNLFSSLIRDYKRHKSIGNRRNWPYFQQLDEAYGNSIPFEIFTIQSDDAKKKKRKRSREKPKLAFIPISVATLQFYNKKETDKRQLLQQICNIAKENLKLQNEEIQELRKLITLLGNKNDL